MHAESRHGTPSLTSLPKDGGVSCFGLSSGKSPIQFLTVHSHASAKLVELAGPLGHSTHTQELSLYLSYVVEIRFTLNQLKICV